MLFSVTYTICMAIQLTSHEYSNVVQRYVYTLCHMNTAMWCRDM